jgi:hypothetical protein
MIQGITTTGRAIRQSSQLHKYTDDWNELSDEYLRLASRGVCSNDERVKHIPIRIRKALNKKANDLRLKYNHLFTIVYGKVENVKVTKIEKPILNFHAAICTESYKGVLLGRNFKSLVLEAFNINDFPKRGKKQGHYMAKNLYIIYLHRYLKYTLREIGEHLQQDYTACHYNIKKFNDDFETDKIYRRTCLDILLKFCQMSGEDFIITQQKLFNL